MGKGARCASVILATGITLITVGSASAASSGDGKTDSAEGAQPQSVQADELNRQDFYFKLYKAKQNVFDKHPKLKERRDALHGRIKARWAEIGHERAPEVIKAAEELGQDFLRDRHPLEIKRENPEKVKRLQRLWKVIDVAKADLMQDSVYKEQIEPKLKDYKQKLYGRILDYYPFLSEGVYQYIHPRYVQNDS